MTPLSRSQRMAMARYRNSRKVKAATARSKRAERLINELRLLRRTRVYPWPRAYYKTPNAERFACPGGRAFNQGPTIPNNPLNSSQQVHLLQYLRPALREWRHWGAKAGIVMCRFGGWSQVDNHRHGCILVTAPRSLRPKDGLFICVNAGIAVRETYFSTAKVTAMVRISQGVLVDKHTYEFRPPERIGPGPWDHPNEVDTWGMATWKQQHTFVQVTRQLPHPIDTFSETLAVAVIDYVREWLINIPIPGPMGV